MKISRISAVVAALIAGAAASFGQLTAKQVFAEAPQSVFPLLDHDTKLDMIDYFEGGMSTASKNAMEGKSRITAMSPEKLGIAMSEASEYELCLLPRVSGDTVVALICTVATPAPDSRMTVYTGDWGTNITSQVFSKPALSEWLTEEGQARAGEVEGLVPFLLVSYSYDPASATLTMTNNTGAFLSADVYELVSPCLKETVTYRWDGKKICALTMPAAVLGEDTSIPVSSITVRELNRRIASLLAVPDTQNVWITAELSDFRQSGGHCYMELIDKNETTGIIDARLRGIIWASNFSRLSARFVAYTGQPLSTGIKVMVKGCVNYHASFGMSFVISDINPAFTLGDVERRRREILERLKTEGILDLNKNVEWSVPALRIAVISAEGAAGYGDFMNQLYSNPYSLKFVTGLFPAILQGERAASSVIGALEAVNAQLDKWDCVVIIRGGGATSDLVSFDNYDLAANVAQFPLPVIVGIGHERDVTVLDYIANMRVKTPTAAAEWLIANAESQLDNLRRIAADMLRTVNDLLSGCKTQLAYLEGQLPVAPVAAVERMKSRLRAASSALVAATAGRMAPAMARLDQMPQAMRVAIGNLLARRNDRLQSANALLDALSPMATLRRGYTITRVNGKVVSSVQSLSPGDKITTSVHDGVMESVVANIKNIGNSK